MFLEEILNASVQIAERCPLALIPFGLIALILILAAVLRFGLTSAPTLLRVVAAVIVIGGFLSIIFSVLNSSNGYRKQDPQTEVSNNDS
jgi:succinate-acetate transporter protein